MEDELCLADYKNKTDLERKKRETIEYIGHKTELEVWTNKESVDIKKFGNKTLKYESVLFH